jgi:hypothetical protein
MLFSAMLLWKEINILNIYAHVKEDLINVMKEAIDSLWNQFEPKITQFINQHSKNVNTQYFNPLSTMQRHRNEEEKVEIDINEEQTKLETRINRILAKPVVEPLTVQEKSQLHKINSRPVVTPNKSQKLRISKRDQKGIHKERKRLSTSRFKKNQSRSKKKEGEKSPRFYQNPIHETEAIQINKLMNSDSVNVDLVDHKCKKSKSGQIKTPMWDIKVKRKRSRLSNETKASEIGKTKTYLHSSPLIHFHPLRPHPCKPSYP